MDWIFYVIGGLLVLLAIYILVREIKRMAKGKSCDNCKGCSYGGSCSMQKQQEFNKDKSNDTDEK